ncbi:hypothetical protein BSNK01_01030 [Bacillaceae bacterium]
MQEWVISFLQSVDVRYAMIASVVISILVAIIVWQWGIALIVMIFLIRWLKKRNVKG